MKKRLHKKIGRLDKLGFQPETIVIVIDIVSESCFSIYVSPTIIFDRLKQFRAVLSVYTI